MAIKKNKQMNTKLCFWIILPVWAGMTHDITEKKGTSLPAQLFPV